MATEKTHALCIDITGVTNLTRGQVYPIKFFDDLGKNYQIPNDLDELVWVEDYRIVAVTEHVGECLEHA